MNLPFRNLLHVSRKAQVQTAVIILFVDQDDAALVSVDFDVFGHEGVFSSVAVYEQFGPSFEPRIVKDFLLARLFVDDADLRLEFVVHLGVHLDVHDPGEGEQVYDVLGVVAPHDGPGDGAHVLRGFYRLTVFLECSVSRGFRELGEIPDGISLRRHPLQLVPTVVE